MRQSLRLTPEALQRWNFVPHAVRLHLEAMCMLFTDGLARGSQPAVLLFHNIILWTHMPAHVI